MNVKKRSGGRFTIRRLMLLTLMLAMGFGWYRALQERDEARTLAYRAETRLRSFERDIRPLLLAPKVSNKNKARRFASGTNMDGYDFRGVQLTTGNSSFQSVSLVGANFANATITCGGSSFQAVNFNHANLSGAKLTATGSSFQIVTFVGADLTGATLNGGNGAVFQSNSFREANLTGATIKCSGIAAFQQVDLDSAILLAADLRAIHPDNLVNAFYTTPPTYDRKTKLPADFDPKAAGWKLVESAKK